MKEISDDIYVSPPPHFSTGRNFPGGNFEKQPRRERENFFYRSEVEKEGERRGKERERREVEEFGGRESLKRRMGYLREFNEIVGKN